MKSNFKLILVDMDTTQRYQSDKGSLTRLKVVVVVV